MAKIEFHHLFISHYRSIICALCSSLSASPPPLAGIKFKLDTDVDSLCHPSVALSLSLSRSLSLSLSLSLSPSLGGQECPQTHFSPEPPLSLFHLLSPCLTLSISLLLSSFHTHTHIYTHTVLSTKLENKGRWGTRGIKVHGGGE